MSATYLERRDPAANRARFYAVGVTPTLFRGWALVREWGRIGSAGTVREDWFGTEEEAQATLARLAQQKERRGYYRLYSDVA